MEILLNCDLVVADETATFALPEVKVGVVASAGGEPHRLSLNRFPIQPCRDPEAVQQCWSPGMS